MNKIYTLLYSQHPSFIRPNRKKNIVVMRLGTWKNPSFFSSKFFIIQWKRKRKRWYKNIKPPLCMQNRWIFFFFSFVWFYYILGTRVFSPAVRLYIFSYTVAAHNIGALKKIKKISWYSYIYKTRLNVKKNKRKESNCRIFRNNKCRLM